MFQCAVEPWWVFKASTGEMAKNYHVYLFIADGLSGLGAALGALAEQGIQMIYDTIHQVLAQGNYVLAVSEGTFGGAPTSYYDLWRVENGKIAEHWDVMETIAEKNT